MRRGGRQSAAAFSYADARRWMSAGILFLASLKKVSLVAINGDLDPWQIDLAFAGLGFREDLAQAKTVEFHF
jgi:hypothetical protein